MTKEKLKEFLLKSSNVSCFKKSYWKNHFIQFYNGIQSWIFPDNFKFTQKIYHYINDDPELKLGHCKVCNNRCCFTNTKKGYRQYCSYKCQHISQEVREKYTETCLQHFGVTNAFLISDVIESSKTKRVQTCIERYCCENPAQFEAIKNKQKETCLEKYGKENYMQTDLYKDKYKDHEFVKSLNQKRHKTLKKNNTFNTSKIEKQLQLYLDGLGVNYEHQYTSDQYPFNCDFYFPDKDLYVEIQGTWTHGPHPFTGSEEDMSLLEKWNSKNTKYYKKAIETWTIRDVKKRETAKKNNLNYLEIFSCNFEAVINKLNKYIK